MSGSSSLRPVAIRTRRAFRTRPPARRTAKPGSISATLILEQLDAIVGHLGPAGGKEIGRCHPVPRKETLHVSRRRVPGRSGIDDGNPAARAAEHESSTQTGRAPTHHHDVKVVFVVFVHVSSLRVAARFSKVCCRFRESLITWNDGKLCSNRRCAGGSRPAAQADPGRPRRHADQARRRDRNLEEHPVETRVRPAQTQPRTAPADRPRPPGPSGRTGRRTRDRRSPHPAQAESPRKAASSSSSHSSRVACTPGR